MVVCQMNCGSLTLRRKYGHSLWDIKRESHLALQVIRQILLITACIYLEVRKKNQFVNLLKEAAGVFYNVLL